MKTTNTEVIDFFTAASNYLARNQEATKLTYALRRMVSRARSVYGRFQEQIEDARVRHASVDEKGNLTRDNTGQYQFTRDEMKAFLLEQRALSEKEVEIEPYIVKAEDLPEDLGQDAMIAFENFCIEPTA